MWLELTDCDWLNYVVVDWDFWPNQYGKISWDLNHMLKCIKILALTKSISSFTVEHFKHYLDSTIHAARKQQVSWVREPPNGRDAFRVPFPRVNVGLGQETSIWRSLRLQVNTHILGYVQEWTALVIHTVLDCKRIIERIHFKNHSRLQPTAWHNKL